MLDCKSCHMNGSCNVILYYELRIITRLSSLVCCYVDAFRSRRRRKDSEDSPR